MLTDRHDFKQEIWLRARRTVAVGLNGLGLAVDRQTVEACVVARTATGRQLLGRLGAELGAEHLWFLTSRGFAGAESVRWRRKLPVVLATAAEYQDKLRALVGPEPAAVEDIASGRGSILFHLAACVLDIITDTLREDAAVFEVLPEAVLGRMCIDLDHDSKVLTAGLSASAVPEVRLFAFLMLRFFQLSRRFIAPERLPQLAKAICAAYEAQRESLTKIAGADHMRISLAKSAEVFRVHALLCGPGTASDDMLSELCVTVGETFALIDDLVDVQEDIERGHANSVLSHVLDLPDNPEARLVAVLGSNAIETVADQALDRIEKVAHQVEGIGGDAERRRAFLNSVLLTVCGWIC